jgi:hypothetical protein
MLYTDQSLNGASYGMPLASSASVFPQYSARVFKEAFAVISLVLLIVAFGMLGTLSASELFGASPANPACTMLYQTSLLSPWCLALI